MNEEQSYPYSPGLKGVPAGKTKISRVDPNGESLILQGYDIRELANFSTFEETAYLTLYSKLPNKNELVNFEEKLREERELPNTLYEIIRTFPKEAHPMDMLRTCVSYLGMYESQETNDQYRSNMEKAIKLIAKMPTAIAASFRISNQEKLIEPKQEFSHAKNFLYTLTEKEPNDLDSKVLDKSLILYIDHDFNASTFGNRVTASTDSDLHSAITGAIGNLKGPLHGGANEKVIKMLLEIGDVENVKNYVMQLISNKRKTPGFGHREYKIRDPRAEILKELFRELSEIKGNMKLYELFEEMENMQREHSTGKGKFPNVDYPCGALYYILGIASELYTPIFAMSRVAGWSAHYIEELTGRDDDQKPYPIIRPKALYIGKSNLKYIPMDER